MTLVAFALGNILGTQTFQASQAPGYIGGKISILVTFGVLCFLVLVLRWCNRRLNERNKEVLLGMGEDEKERVMEGLAFADQTDRQNPFFRYTR